jgi:hypothetical protein
MLEALQLALDTSHLTFNSFDSVDRSILRIGGDRQDRPTDCGQRTAGAMTDAGFGTHAALIPLPTKHARAYQPERVAARPGDIRREPASISGRQGAKLENPTGRIGGQMRHPAPAFYRDLLEFTRFGSGCVVNSTVNARSVNGLASEKNRPSAAG